MRHQKRRHPRQRGKVLSGGDCLSEQYGQATEANPASNREINRERPMRAKCTALLTILALLATHPMAGAQVVPGSPYGGGAALPAGVCVASADCAYSAVQTFTGGTSSAAGIGIGTTGNGFYSTGTNIVGMTIAARPRFYIQQQPKDLTEGAATGFIRVAVASAGIVGGVIEYSVQATDGTDHQSRSGSIPFSVVNKAGTETCTVGTAGGSSEIVAVSSGTLTAAFTCDTTPANAVDLQINATSSLTQTTLRVYYSITKHTADLGAFTAL